MMLNLNIIKASLYNKTNKKDQLSKAGLLVLVIPIQVTMKQIMD